MIMIYENVPSEKILVDLLKFLRIIAQVKIIGLNLRPMKYELFSSSYFKILDIMSVYQKNTYIFFKFRINLVGNATISKVVVNGGRSRSPNKVTNRIKNIMIYVYYLTVVIIHGVQQNVDAHETNVTQHNVKNRNNIIVRMM